MSKRLIATIATTILSIAPVSPVHASNRPVPTKTPDPHTCPKYEAKIRKHGLPVKLFSYVGWRESRCNPRAVSVIRVTGWPDVGYAQIQGSWNTLTRRICHVKPNESHIKALTNIDCNLSVAKYLYDRGGYKHWKPSK